MSEQQQLTRLISSVYDAALDPVLWPETLAKIADFTGGRVGGLIAKDLTNNCVAANCHAGLDSRHLQLYAEKYCKLGPIATSLFNAVEQVVNVPELMPYDEFCRGCFYREWAQPQGWVDVAIGVLEKSASGCAYLTVARDEASGMVDDEMRQRMALVVPHVRRAVLVGKTIAFKRAEAETFADVLDNLSAGVFFVDARARIVHANAAGSDLLGDGSLLRPANGRLTAVDAEADQALRKAIAAAGDNDEAIGIKGVALPLSAHNGERYVAHALPLTSGARRRTGALTEASAVLFVHKAAMDRPLPAEVIGRTYNLTPAELRVLLGIVEIGGVPEVAAAFGVAETTVKTHLGRLFEKTGATRQADLVKLAAGFSTPLAN